MFLDAMVFNINEAAQFYGLTGETTETKLILNFIITPIMLYFIMTNKKVIASIDKIFFPESITMLLCILLIDMLIMKDAYTFILVVFFVIWFFYILFNHKKYQRYKDSIVSFIDRFF